MRFSLFFIVHARTACRNQTSLMDEYNNDAPRVEKFPIGAPGLNRRESRMKKYVHFKMTILFTEIFEKMTLNGY